MHLFVLKELSLQLEPPCRCGATIAWLLLATSVVQSASQIMTAPVTPTGVCLLP